MKIAEIADILPFQPTERKSRVFAVKQPDDKIVDQTKSEVISENLQSEFLSRYLHGRCDALAIALSVATDLPIVAFYPLHHLKDGSIRRDPDFVHVAVQNGQQFVDARGQRTGKAMLADFASLLSLVKRPEDIEVTAEPRLFDNAEEFISEANPNAAEAIQAFNSLIKQPQLAALVPSDRNFQQMVQRELSQLVG